MRPAVPYAHSQPESENLVNSNTAIQEDSEGVGSHSPRSLIEDSPTPAVGAHRSVVRVSDAPTGALDSRNLDAADGARSAVGTNSDCSPEVPIPRGIVPEFGATAGSHAPRSLIEASRVTPIRAHGSVASTKAVSYTHLRAHETDSYLVCRLLLEKKKD